MSLSNKFSRSFASIMFVLLFEVLASVSIMFCSVNSCFLNLLEVLMILFVVEKVWSQICACQVSQAT